MILHSKIELATYATKADEMEDAQNDRTNNTNQRSNNGALVHPVVGGDKTTIMSSALQKASFYSMEAEQSSA